eukprot:sb/3475580/
MFDKNKSTQSEEYISQSSTHGHSLSLSSYISLSLSTSLSHSVSLTIPISISLSLSLSLSLALTHAVHTHKHAYIMSHRLVFSLFPSFTLLNNSYYESQKVRRGRYTNNKCDPTISTSLLASTSVR